MSPSKATASGQSASTTVTVTSEERRERLFVQHITAKKDSDGSITIHFGVDPSQSNYPPTMKPMACQR